MLQQVINDVKEIQKKFDSTKVEASTSNADTNNGKGIQRPIHRCTFRRTIVKPDYVEGADSTTRFYFESMKIFNSTLKMFNEENDEEYFSVGYANVRLRFCSRCYDNFKKLPLDMYFVNRKTKSVIPKILCLGCIGVLLRKFQEETDSGNETK